MKTSEKTFILFVVCMLCVFGAKSQIISTIAGGAVGHGGYWGEGGHATAAQIEFFAGISVNRENDVYISNGHRILKIDAITNIISTVAGTGIGGYNGEGIPATNAKLNTPICIVFDKYDNLYFYDSKNNRIRKIEKSTGIISTFAGNGTFDTTGDGGPATAASIDGGDMAWDDLDNLYFTSTYKIRRISVTGIISTYIGDGKPGTIIDGVHVTSTALAPARGIAFDRAGNMYLADSTCSVRKISASTGIIARIAGTGDGVVSPYSGDGIAASSCHLNPFDISLDDSGNLYISDYANSRIEKVDTFGTITTIAGLGVAGFGGDGGTAILAKINLPENVVLDECNNIYIADFNNARVRKVTYHIPCNPALDIANASKKSILIYPNPTNGILHIDNLQTAAGYRLLNMVGAEVMKGNLRAGNNCIPLYVANGVYMLEVTDNVGIRAVTRVIKK